MGSDQPLLEKAAVNNNNDNIFLTNEVDADDIQTTPVKSMNVSPNKIQKLVTETPKQSDPKITGYRLIDVEIMAQVIETLLCPKCKHNESPLKGAIFP